MYIKGFIQGPLAQLVEHLPFKEGVDGSSPSGLTKLNFNWWVINHNFINPIV